MDKPELEQFNMSESEVDQELKVGEIGTITIPVVVVSIEKGQVTFRKAAKAHVDAGFRKETLDEMRERIIDEQEESKETTDEEATEDESKE